jgi:uncharacterized protein
MPTRDRAPIGAPCWADLWIADVDGARRFYGELFGWEADAPNPEFGGYFMFNRSGVPVAGGMGDMPGMPADNRWKIYLTTDDVDKTLEQATAAGAEVVSGAMPVADLGVQAVLTDPTGAAFGIWQPRTFGGFSVLGEPGAPGWFELHTREHDAAVAFYRSVFGLRTRPVADSDDFRYTTLQHPGNGDDLAGIMDARGSLGRDEPAGWTVYWTVADTDAAAAKVTALGGAVLMAPQDTPYGRMATATDPAGAKFMLHGPVVGQ